MKTFTVATFNANSIRSRLPAIFDWLAKRRPDVLAIQETKAQDADFPGDAIRGAGYHVVFAGEKSYNGVALLSREPAVDLIHGFGDNDTSDATRLIAARFGPVFVVNTYVPQGRTLEHEMYAYKLEWFARLRSFFSKHFTPKSPLLWVGDINVAPTPQDLHSPEAHEKHVCFHVDVRDAFAKTMAWGFTDVFRKHNPGAGHYSFFDYRTVNAVKRGIGWRIDHILATAPMADACISCEIDLKPRLAPKASDHTFVHAAFDTSVI